MNFILFVSGPPYGTQNSITAFLFVKSILFLNHHIKKIFFYASGVYNANAMISPPINEFNILKGWLNLKKKYNLKLCICPGSAYRRGILLDKSIIKPKYIQEIYSSSFNLTSLNELSYSINNCDRIIQF
ncbi:sulfurtransferase complex subunit TusD [Buchnera aphidicola]|uniref:Sulfurtransferase TusD n=1 Tax=Buchnera aphidicola (Cinara curvipes) TaxID=2518975 RepID=A0A451D7G5_9GAMM|nr:sulfurtransferase complex subunit TusD [Buchnera aphidicola]VFP81634.1 Sulfurtransferase TusD [Buchnera aphidicola (Cinara curvipes)]